MLQITRLRMENGIRLIHEFRPDSPSVAVHAVLATGSRHEPPQLNGITHFLEHMLFKGTHRHDVFELARLGNLLGGGLNASTSHDTLRITNRVITEDLGRALDLTRELLLESAFPAEELERERDVILEEIAEANDSPEDVCFDNFLSQLWLSHPLGRPILGTEETVGGITRDDLRAWWKRIVRPENLILSVAGGCSHETLLSETAKAFGDMKFSSRPPSADQPAAAQGGCISIQRSLEQVHFCLGTDAITRKDPGRYAFALLDVILGGGMGSRLFNEIREKRGLAYTIGTSGLTGVNEGYLMIYGSTVARNIDEVLELCRAETARIAQQVPSDEEVRTAVDLIVRSFLLGLESNGFRAFRNADREYAQDEWVTDVELIRRLRQVTADEIRQVAGRVFGKGDMTLSLVGPQTRDRSTQCA